MRKPTSFVSIAGLAGALGIVAAFAACGSDVTETPPLSVSGVVSSVGATSATGAGGAISVGTTASPSTAVGPASSTASSSVGSGGSGVGGGNSCDHACAKVDACMVGDLCGQFNIDCTNPMFDCPAACIEDASCDDLAKTAAQMPPPSLIACIGGCMGTGPASSSSASGSASAASGGDNVACGKCLPTSCGSQLLACGMDADCGSWLKCAAGCFNQAGSCLDACNQQFPTAQKGYAPVYECACQSCAAECPNIDACAMSGAGGASGAGGSP